MEVNQRGNEITRSFEGDIVRFRFVFVLCSLAKGWIQFDTDQDAWYFGIRIHKQRKQIVTYAEGDVFIIDAPTVESFNKEIKYMCEFYGKEAGIRTIDGDGIYTKYYQDRKECFISTC